MKPSKYTFFTSLLCASGLSAGLCFCVMTSFAVPADGLSLVCACVLAALLFSALLLQAEKAGSFRRTAAVRHIDRGQK